jgi:hypothetical protein
MANFATRALRGAGLEPETQGTASKLPPGTERSAGLGETVAPGTSPASDRPEGALLGSLFSHWSDTPGLATGTKQSQDLTQTTKLSQNWWDSEEAPSEKTSKDAPRRSAPADLATGTKQSQDLTQTTKLSQSWWDSEEAPSEKTSKNTPRKAAPDDSTTDEKSPSEEAGRSQ